MLKLKKRQDDKLKISNTSLFEAMGLKKLKIGKKNYQTRTGNTSQEEIETVNQKSEAKKEPTKSVRATPRRIFKLR